MRNATVDLTECPQCARRVRASAPTCIYCGAKTADGPIVASVPAAPAVRRQEQHAAESAPPPVAGCPLCTGELGAHTVAIETWESAGITFTGK